MKLGSGNKILNLINKFLILFVFVFLAISISGCTNSYEQVRIILSNDGKNVTLYIQDGVSSTEEIVVTVESGNNVSKQVNVSVENDKLNVAPVFNQADNTTTLTLSVNVANILNGKSAVFKDALVTVSTKEGGKFASFYVSVEIALSSISQTLDVKNLYAVRGGSVSLEPDKMLNFEPESTTQKSIIFTLLNPSNNAEIVDNVLRIDENYTESTIQILAESASDSEISTVLTLDVIEPLSNEIITYSAFFTDGVEEINLDETIKIAPNLIEKNYIMLYISIQNFRNINIEPYMQSTGTETSRYASVVQISKTPNDSEIGVGDILDEIKFVFKIGAESLSSGEETVFFDISYSDYNYILISKEFNLEIYDAVRDIAVLVDDLSPENYNFVVYDLYHSGILGMKINATVSPTTVPNSDKVLILKRGINAGDYEFYDTNGFLISFVNDEFEFLSGENIFVKAKSGVSGDAIFTIASKTDNNIFKQFNITAQKGASDLYFSNATEVNNYFYYYLTSNEEIEKRVEFTVNNANINDIEIIKVGDSFEVVKPIRQGTDENTFYFFIKSIKNMPDEVGTLTILMRNGLSVGVYVEVFAQLEESDILVSIPTSQYNNSIGKKELLSDETINDIKYNVEFSVALKNNNNIPLNVTANSRINVYFTFYDLVLEGSAYDEDYLNFEEFSEENGNTNPENYLTTSSVIRSLFLNNLKEINAINVGKVWVRAQVMGHALNDDGIKVEQSYYFYFLVEVYNPVTVFSLSKSATTLYSLNSVGDSHKSNTFEQISVLLNANATYNEIKWTNDYADFAEGENSMSHTENDEKIFTFTNNVDNILVEAFSTLYSYDSMGMTHYAYSNELTFIFTARIDEFGTIKHISLKLTIKKAQQVKQIVVDNLNIENGIYLELNYNDDINYPIIARADNGLGNPKPLNENLIYEFFPSGSTSENLISINRNTGWINILKDQTIGGYGVIRIAPADRYINGLYSEGETDVAIYIGITVADGRSRETAFRIANLSDLTNNLLHYILMNNTEITSDNDYAIFETFSGGLYGSVNSKALISTIVTNKTLFKLLTEKAIVEDLIVCGDISESYNAFIAETNHGTIKNVTVDTNSKNSTYVASLLTVEDFEYAGGIVGKNFGKIENSNFYGKIIASNSITGGIAGFNEGNISYCTVEFYNFTNNDYASISGGNYVGGLVGEMSGGNLKFSFAYSYVSTGEPKNYINLNVLSGSKIGALIGLQSGGNVDICFAYINDINELVGEFSAENEGNIVNAYIIYNINNNTLNASYIYYGTSDFNFNNITSDNVWQGASAGINFGYPYFKSILQASTVTLINSSLNQNLINMISVEGKSVIYFYASNTSLTKQETTIINNLNTISYSSLLGETDVSGIRAISSNSLVVSTYSNGIVINGPGAVKLTIHSKYDYSISKTFEIYVIYPTLNFKLSYENNLFESGSIINSKLIDSLNIHGSLSESIILVDRSINFLTNNINIIFNSCSDYITGSGKGGFVFDTQKIYEDTGLTELEIEYTLNLINLPSKFLFGSEGNELSEINSILSDYFSSSFYIKLYKGTDNLILTYSVAEIEPSDEYTFEAYVFSDMAFDVSDGVFNGEGLGVNVFDKESLETPYEILNTETSGDRKTVYYYIGQNQTVMFTISLEHIGTIYYLSSLMSEQTLDEMLAVYYQHKFRISITIADEFKGYNFDNNEYLIKVYALSSLINSETYNANIISEDFNLTVKSQTVLSLDANHYSISSKNLQVVGNENVVFYKYQPQTSGVLTPAGEGLLAIDVYPVYANFDYLTVTYQASAVGDYQLRLALLNKQGDAFTKSTKGFTNLTNGIKITNEYKYSQLSTALSNLYLSTYISEKIDRDLVFTITTTAYNSADDQVGISISFNLIVQYLKSASVNVQDKDGNTLDTVVRGATEYLVIVVDSEQNLGSINFQGYRYTPDANNYISYTSFMETHNQTNGTKTYKAGLNIGSGLVLENDSNYFSIEVTISWIVNGKMQTKTTVLNIGLVDFTIESILLKTDRLDKTSFTGYVGIQNTLKFDFNIKDFLSSGLAVNPALQEFYQKNYYKDASGLNEFGDYIVNYGFENIGSLMGNLYYVRQNTHLQVLNANGTFVSDPHFTFVLENDGTIKIVGKQAGSVSMLLSIPVKYPSFNKNLIKNIDFYFTINIELYSDEDTPLIIDSEDAFYNALNGENPQDYILMSDLFLTDYTPLDTTGISSLDGNNYVINILNFNLNPDGNALRLALFNNVKPSTTLKNLIVNVYHASLITVNTIKYSSIEVAGMAINNAGIIYNCHIVAYKVDYTRPNLVVPQGLNLTYSSGQIGANKTSRLAGFVLDNTGSITNSRVGGENLEFALSGKKELLPFNLVGQGNIAGFVYNNNGSIASSYFSNGTITNNTASGTQTFTAGFAGTNNGSIQISYAKGVGENEFSLSEAGISTASISAGFTYTNKGNIGDCYSNIILTTANNATKTEYASGRLTSGFVYINEGTVERCYTASKIEDAKTTQMNFIGVNDLKEMQNTGIISNSYYYNAMSNILEDAYTTTDSNISVRRIIEPDLSANFYGFTFADSSQSLNGVWHITNKGPELVSANQIAVSCRYLADEKRDAVTGELVSYSLPYYENYEYGSALNPIIIRNAFEFNRVFGGDHSNAGTSISKYYDLSKNKVFGNYRIVTNLNLSDLLTDDVSGVKINSSNMMLSAGVLDGNMFNLYGLELVAKIEGVSSVKNYGMFAGLENYAIIMNMQIEVIGVNAVTIQNVGAVAGSVTDSKLVNLVLYSGNSLSSADVIGRNMVGGVVGKVVGESEIKNITSTSINIVVDHVATGTSQKYNRDETSTNKLNSSVSYAGGIAGVVDTYKNTDKTNLEHNERLINPQLAFLTVNGTMRISGSTVGGIVGYLGPQTLLKDATFELSSDKTQKLIAYNYSAGGIVGQCYGDLDMVRTQHEYIFQTEIENNVSEYYSNPATANVERGNLSLFEHEEIGKYTPKNIGGLVGELITGNISHSYSKLPVRNTKALYAGGVVGAVTYAENKAINNINFYEVYTFSDVSGSLASGGVIGYIEQTRTLYFDKVNAVNYWTLHKDEINNVYFLPEGYYDIYSMTGTRNIEAKYIKDIVDTSFGDIRIKEGFSKYSLPVISQEVHSEDVYAMSLIKFNYGGQNNSISVNKSYASLGSNNFFEIIDETKQSIIPLFEYKGAQQSGEAMDAYFRNSDWDLNYWKRYQTDMLPRLISSADINIFYIYVASDLMNMIYYPDATFIVVGLDGNGIVKVGNYIKTTGWSLNNFSGVLKGYDNSGNYGFDFEGYSLTFINSTITGSKIYNLTIKNLGSSGTQYQAGVGSFVGTSDNTEFENLNFVKCLLYAYATSEYSNIGLLCGHIKGGFISNISFEDCAVNVFVNGTIDTLNVGLMAGLISTPTNAYMQIADITAYMSVGNINSSIYNDIKININGNQVTNVNAGTIAGSVDGTVFLSYTSKTVLGNRTKNLGISDTAGFTFSPDTISGENHYGVVLDITGSGTVEKYNAGIGFGVANVLNLSYLRSTSAFKIAGAIISTGSVSVGEAVLGGYVGKSLTSSVINNGSGSSGNYMFVDCDIKFTAGSTTAGMLVGEANTIYSLKNVDTYGTINVNSKTTSSYIGGIVGKLNSDLDMKNCISRTAIEFKDTVNDASAIGGFIGFIASPNGKVVIGEDFFSSKYLGTMKISANRVYVGGIVGAINAKSTGDIPSGAGTHLSSAVFGGQITINETNQAYVGGIVGTTNYNDGTKESVKLIENCFSYGSIYINEDFSDNTESTYSGGIIGRGSQFTNVNSNYSALTVYTKYTQTQSALTVNAVVGQTNGAVTENDLTGFPLVNYYSHQLSLCLDNSGISAENVYYYTKSSGSTTMFDVIQLYISRLSQKDLEQEAYLGSKLSPYIIRNQNYAELAPLFADTSKNNIKYFVIGELLNENQMKNVELYRSFIIGDGFALRATERAVFSKIDELSTVTGITVKVEIKTNSTTSYARSGSTYYGVGTLADVNNGFIYSCNATEQVSAKNYSVYGLINSNSGSSVYVGGLVGVNTGYISDCFANMDVAGASSVGGFAGLNLGVISHSYSNGTVSSGGSYPFALNSNPGSIFYSYTASMAYTATVNASYEVNVTANSGVSPFGSGKVENCFYDIYAVNCSDSLSTLSITDKMAVADSDNFLPYLDSNETDSAGKLIPKVFLSDEDNENDTAKIKFGYDYRYNNGYLSFIGTAYETLSYMSDFYTGDGLAEGTAIEITNPGKLQQINDALPSYHYVLVRNIVVTSGMISSGADADITNWKAIGSQANKFTGNISGKYMIGSAGYRFSISGLALNGTSSYGSIFGVAENASISYIDIDSLTISGNASFSAGILSEGNNVDLFELNLGTINLTYNSSNQTYMGGLVGNLCGNSTVENCFIQNINVQYLGTGSSTPSYLGGFVGKVSGNVEISSCEINGTVDLTYNSTGGAYLGGIAGSVEGSSSNALMEDIAIRGNINIKNQYSANSTRTDYFGAIAGFTNFASFQDIDITGTKNTFTNNIGSCYIGGWIGQADSNTNLDFSSINISATNDFIVTSGNTNSAKSYIGGLFGKINNLTLTPSQRFNVPNNKFQYQSVGCVPYIGGFAGEIEETKLSNIGVTFNNEQISFYSSAGVYVGGLVGSSSGDSSVANCNVSYSSSAFTFSITQKIEQAHIGGLVGITAGKFSVSNCNISQFNITDLFVGSGEVGGLIANANSELNISSSTFKNSTFSVKSVGEVALGGIVGKLSSTNATLNECGSDKIKLTVTEGVTAKIGGIIGNASGMATLTKCSLEGSIVSESNLKYIAKEGSSNSYIGGIIGDAVGNAVDAISFVNCEVSQNCNLLSENQTSTSGVSHIGGIAGHTSNTKIGNKNKVLNLISVYTDNGFVYLGGVVGKAENSSIGADDNNNAVLVSDISLILASGQNQLFNTTNGAGFVGGIAGWVSENSTVKYSKVEGSSIIANGSTSSMQNSGSAGGIVGYSNGNLTVQNVSSSANVASYSLAGGIVGAGDATISDATTISGTTVSAGRTINVSGSTEQFYLQFNNSETSYAGGIISKLDTGTISNCNNNANVFAGYKEGADFGYNNNPRTVHGATNMKGWSVGISEVQENNGSVTSYAGGVAGYSGSSVQINESNNYGNVEAKAKEILVTECVYFSTEGVAGMYGDHKIYACYTSEHSYANGISYIAYGAGINTCYSSGQIAGGCEVGFNFLYNTSYFGFGNEKFYLLQYGTRSEENFNAILYAYSWNQEIRNKIINADVLVGMAVLWEGGHEAYHIYNENLFYVNNICNNPNVDYQGINVGPYSFKALYYYNSYYQVTNCRYTGNINKQLLPATFGETPVFPEPYGDYSNYIPIVWPAVPSNDPNMGVSYGTFG